MKNDLFPNSFLKAFLTVWVTTQTLLPKVIRWQKYVSKKDGQGGARIQNSLQHSYSIGLFAIALIQKLCLHIKLDGVLLRDAVLIHDLGEGDPKKKRKHGDTHYIDKTEAGDLREYLQFIERFKELDQDTLLVYRKAFLLQFALKNPESFPEDAREIMQYLAEHKTAECHAFNAIERLDYLFFAIEQFETLGNVKILVQTLRGNIEHLNELADVTLPAIAHEFWTPRIREWCNDLLKENEGKFIEQKGEK